MTYEGHLFVEPLGTHRIELGGDSFVRLAAMVERHGFWDLADRYDIPFTDAATRIITVEAEDRSKCVTDYGLAGPSALQSIERAITGRLRRVGLARPTSEFTSEDDGMGTAGQKAAVTRKRRAAGKKAASTRKRRGAGKKAAVKRKRSLAGKKAAVTKRRSKAAKKAAATRAARKVANT